MKPAKKVLPIFFALVFVFGISYYFFSVYRPNIISQVKGAKSIKSDKNYLDSIPMPSQSQEVGRNERDGFSQITVSSPRTSQEIQKFFRGVLISKGWKLKDSSEDLLSTTYTRDQEKIDISVLSFNDTQGTVFSISHSN
jgi:hypothetical protein